MSCCYFRSQAITDIAITTTSHCCSIATRNTSEMRWERPAGSSIASATWPSAAAVQPAFGRGGWRRRPLKHGAGDGLDANYRRRAFQQRWQVFEDNAKRLRGKRLVVVWSVRCFGRFSIKSVSPLLSIDSARSLGRGIAAFSGDTRAAHRRTVKRSTATVLCLYLSCCEPGKLDAG